MAAALIKSLKPVLAGYIDKAKGALPGGVTRALASLSAWLPTAGPWITGTGIKALDWAKVQMQKNL